MPFQYHDTAKGHGTHEPGEPACPFRAKHLELGWAVAKYTTKHGDKTTEMACPEVVLKWVYSSGPSIVPVEQCRLPAILPVKSLGTYLV